MLPPSPAVIGFYQPGQRNTARPQLLRLVTRQGTGDEKRPQRSSTRDGSRWLDRSWQRSQIAPSHVGEGLQPAWRPPGSYAQYGARPQFMSLRKTYLTRPF